MSYSSIDDHTDSTLHLDEMILKDDQDDVAEEFFTDEATYINIIFNILNLIYSTSPHFGNKTELSSIPIHLLFDRVYYQYSNLLSNPNIDRFIIKNYKEVEEALEFYLVNYCSFEQLRSDDIDLSFYKQANVPMNIYTPNLMSKCSGTDDDLYIIQHHIGGIRNSQCYITNDLSFKADGILKEEHQRNIKRKRFLYLDHKNKVQWMVNIDDMLNDNAIISILPLSLIIKENNKNTNRTSKKNKFKNVFLTNKILNFFFYAHFQIHNMNGQTLYKYIHENKTLPPASNDKEDEFFIDRIMKTGGFDQNYGEIHKLPSQTEYVAAKLQQESEELILSKSPTALSPVMMARSPISSAGTATNSYGRSVTFKKQRPSQASTLVDGSHQSYDSIPNINTIMSRSSNHYMFDDDGHRSERSFKKNFLLVISPISKILIFVVLLQMKTLESKNTMIIISNSWRCVIAASLLLSICFTFCNLLLLTYTKLEIILALTDATLVFVLIVSILMWIL